MNRTDIMIFVETILTEAIEKLELTKDEITKLVNICYDKIDRAKD